MKSYFNYLISKELILSRQHRNHNEHPMCSLCLLWFKRCTAKGRGGAEERRDGDRRDEERGRRREAGSPKLGSSITRRPFYTVVPQRVPEEQSTAENNLRAVCS